MLIGRSENLVRGEAEQRYEEIMKFVGLLTQAGSRRTLAPHRSRWDFYDPAPVATENLLAHYARLVMLPDHWEVGERSEWQEQWAGTVVENPSADPCPGRNRL